MTTFLATLAVFGLAMLGLASGLLLGRGEPRSCGNATLRCRLPGLSCAGCPRREDRTARPEGSSP